MKPKATPKPSKSPARSKTKKTKAIARNAKKTGKSVKPSASKTNKKKQTKAVPTASLEAPVAIVPLTTSTSTSWTVEPGRPNANAHLGKNKKKAWRRVNVDDVEVFLDDQRRDERTGADSVAVVPDSDLFVLDSKGGWDENPPVEVKKLIKKVVKLPRPAPVDPMTMPCFRYLRNTSKVGPAIGGVNRVRTPDERQLGATWRTKVELKRTERAVEGLLDRKKAAKLRAEREKKAKIKQLGKKAVFYDLWGAEGNPEAEKKDEVELDGSELIKHTFIDHLKTIPPKAPRKLHHNPCELPKVELPHPGMSYNPRTVDHQELVEVAVEAELKKDAENAKWLKKTIGMFPTREQAPTEQDTLLEMAEGLFEEEEKVKEKKEEEGKKPEEGGPSGGDQEDEAETVYKAPIRAEDRKTRQKRRREHEAKMKAIEAAEARKLNQKESEVFRIKQIRKELDAKDKAVAQKRAFRKKKAETWEKFGTKKMSRYEFEEPEAPVKFVNEITGSLRQLKPEGHLLADRYKSLQKRNVIETRVKQKGPKRKLKRFMTRDKRKFMLDHGIQERGMFKQLSWH